MARAKRKWAADPQMSDEKIREGTGKGWEEWRALIEASPVHDKGHKAIADWLVAAQGLGGWWAQSVTVGYERIVGIRLPHQMADGSFSFGISRTVAVDADTLREALLSEKSRAAHFPETKTELRSRPTSKNVRIGLEAGAAEFAITGRADGKAQITIQHSKLESPEQVEEWRAWWAKWLGDLETRLS